MNTLPLPEQLKGPWDHVLVLTYGLNIPFFERSLWPQLAARCRNKIILADGQHYLQACEDYAQRKGLVRYLNQSYVVAGIFGPHATHAKLILLTNPEQGRLLVGSGNLNWQGYASGGELFTVYDYSLDLPETLPAFIAVREMVDELIRRYPPETAAQQRISYMWEQTPWFFSSPTSTQRPVRNNLAHSFLDQIVQVIGADPVEELWILVPFFDKEAIALKRLLNTLHPGKTMLLVQPDHTSIDPVALQRVLDHFQGYCEVCPFQIDSDAYVHAKCYLLKLADRAICLEGSPNLSQVAMLLTDPHGNVEAANLLIGSRDAFDYLLEALHIGPPVTEFSTLHLSYQAEVQPEELSDEAWRLTGGEWYGNHLSLNFQGTLPDLQGAALLIADEIFSLTILKFQARSLDLLLPPEATALLAQPVPLAILWVNGEATSQTNALFVCNRATLDAALQDSLEDELLDHTADLDLDDKDIEELLSELNETLVIDRRSVWQLAGRTIPPHAQDDETALHLDYADIDYQRLRQHPKIQQYLHGATSGQAYRRSRLQMILNAITAYLQKIVAGPPITASIQTIAADVEESEEALTEEIAEAVEERQKRHWSTQQRIEQILKHFIQRYLQGLRSPDFQAFASYEMVAQNYIIFTHLLWRLFSKNWVDLLFVVDALLQSWTFFWGDGGQPGYFRQLSPDQQEQVLLLVENHHHDASSLAALFYAATVAISSRAERQLFALRTFWRELLLQMPFSLRPQLLVETQRLLAQLLPYDSPSPTTIMSGLVRLARFDTRSHFLRRLEAPDRYQSGSCTIEHPSVFRHQQGQAVQVDCLVIRAPDALPDQESAVALLQEWMEAEEMDYYRITITDANDKTHLIFYDVLEQKGKYWVQDLGGRGQALGVLTRPTRAWDSVLAQLQTLATQLDEKENPGGM
jgi:hypothetical protein